MTKEEQLRYSRHMIMPEVGAEGQRRLNEARVHKTDEARVKANLPFG